MSEYEFDLQKMPVISKYWIDNSYSHSSEWSEFKITINGSNDGETTLCCKQKYPVLKLRLIFHSTIIYIISNNMVKFHYKKFHKITG